MLLADSTDSTSAGGNLIVVPGFENGMQGFLDRPTQPGCLFQDGVITKSNRVM